MPASIVSGKDIAASVREELKEQVSAMADEGLVPGLATVIVGADPASQLYVGMKNKAAKETGIYSRQVTLAEDTTEDELLGVIEGLNADPWKLLIAHTFYTTAKC